MAVFIVILFFSIIGFAIYALVNLEIIHHKACKKNKELEKLNKERAEKITVGTKLRRIGLYADPFKTPSYKDIEITGCMKNADGELWYQYKENLGGLKTLETSPAKKIIEDHKWKILK